MTGAEQCGYVIRYGSFRAMRSPYGDGSSRVQALSLFINARPFSENTAEGHATTLIVRLYIPNRPPLRC
jgi:hypothetical protein